jgi:hypothetical protein
MNMAESSIIVDLFKKRRAELEELKKKAESKDEQKD